ncbi:Beige/BEACH domain containing protein [Trichomonas vaginalis G3]|uniref:Beige/BEACH domain containing protein n=1 Tax=Trichomonas vaginalis (strain ATCC PRA-98 / G3) TaxID=412133 RepID=A2DFN3_TRIV3|nr:beige/BEACH-related family [Trichomonas vaginalis G3]EAY20736.1 Beige/BEACH domain containing protein [Trichomonas vaginalis G3]KAI5529489.1 beige/BEACH-related family [Trichomonas vaginalis G3]|eukprot:XP_001581722.1 Beige/BEACH domain containing protein [Trichomonas vaginalis G3]
MIERARLKKLIQSVDNKYYQDCLAQFSKEVDVTKSTLYDDMIFQSLLDNFNLKPIPIPTILEQSEFIKKSPDEAIPKILQFHRSIDASYFMVMIQLTKSGFAKLFTWDNMVMLFPELYRCLALASYQVDLIPIACGKETGFIPSTFIRSLVGFVNMIIFLPEENALSIAVVIQQITKQIAKQLKEAFDKGVCKTFIDDMLDLSSSISVVLFSKKLGMDYELSFLTYLIKVNSTFLANNVFQDKRLPFLQDFESTLATLYSNSHITDKTVSYKIVEMISTFLNMNLKYEYNEKTSKVSESMFKILLYLHDYNNCDINKLAKATAQVIKCHISNLVSVITIDYGQNETKSYDHTYKIESTDFVTIQTINNNIIKVDYSSHNISTETVQNIFSTINSNFLNLVYQVAEKNSTFYCDLISDLSVFVKENPNPAIQLFLVDLMCRAKQEVLSILFSSRLPLEWTAIINKNSFSTNVIINKAPPLYGQLHKKVCEIIEKSFLIESKEATSLSMIMCQFLRSNMPYHVGSIVKLFYLISKRNPTQLLEVFLELQIIPMLIQIDMIYKYQFTNGDSDPLLIDIHTYILLTFVEMTRITDFVDNLAIDAICSTYVLSLMLERKAEQITIAFCRNLLKNLHSSVFMERLKIFLTDISKRGIEYIEPFTNLLDSIRSSMLSGNQSVSLLFKELNFIECICNAVNQFAEYEGDPNIFFLLVSVSLNTFMSFCQTSNDNLISFNNASKLFNQTYCKAITKTTLNEALADLLISLCLNETTTFQTESRPRVIKNTAALWLLYNLTKSSTLSDRIFAYLLAIISSSVENCYHCYICGFLMHIIKDMDNFAPNILFQLIIIIGSHFYGIGELTAIFNQLRKTDQKFAPHLFDAIFNMFKTKMRIPLSTGFYVENQSTRYFTPAFYQFHRFKLSFSCYVKPDQTINAIKISSTRESLLFTVGKNLLIRLFFDASVIERTYSHPKPLTINQWNQVTCIYEEGFIKVIVNGVTHDQPIQFDFTSDPIFFEHLDRDRTVVQIESISITDIISTNDQIMIYNHSVPFPLSFFDILPLAGGPQIFLPFFERIQASNKRQYLLIKCMQVIGVAMREFEDQLTPLFFRAFGHLLKQVPIDSWTDSAAKELKEIAEKINDQRLIVAVLQYVFLDIAIWQPLPNNLQEIFLKALKSIKNKNPNLFFNTFDFELVFSKFFNFLKTSNSTFLVTTILELLVTYPSINTNSVMALLSVSFSREKYDDNAMMLTFAIQNKFIKPFLTVLGNYGIYRPFIELSCDENDRTRFWSLHILYQLYKQLNTEQKNDFNKHILFLGQEYPIQEENNILNSILGFILDEIKVFNQFSPTCTVQTKNNYTVRNPIFFVLFTSIAATSKQKSQTSAEILISTIQSSMESRIALRQINHWMFWLSLFFKVFSNQEEFGKTLAMFAIDIGKEFDSYYFYSFLILACAKYGWEWSICAGKFILELLDKMFCKNTLKIVFLYLTLPHQFMIDQKLNFDEKNHLIDLIICFFSKQPIPVSFEFKNHYTEWNSNYTRDIYTSILAHAVSNPKLFNMEIDFSSFHVISLINIITLLIDLYYDVPTSSAPSFCTSFISHFMNVKEINVGLYTALYYMYTIKNLRKSDKEQIKQVFFNQGKNIIAIREIAFKSKSALQHLFETIIPDFQATVTKMITEISDTSAFDLTSHNFEMSLKKLKSDANHDSDEFSEQLNKHEEQLSRQNAKVWSRIWKSLQEDGGPWSIVDPKQYWKLDPTVDGYGRHFRLKKNRHFDLHEEASRQRDSGIKTVEKKQIEPFQLYAPKEIQFEQLTFIHFECQMLTQTLLFKGNLHIYKNSIIFESTEALESTEDGLQKGIFKNIVREIEISDILYVLNRRFMHHDNSCEIFTKKRESYFFILPEGVRSAIYKKLKQMNVYCQIGNAAKVLKDFKVVERWQSGKISNYYYLYLLNIISGRSFNDLNQYPVFPWVLKNYTSETIDLQDANNYRDFSKPMGAMDKDRLEGLLMIYNEINDPSMKCMYRVFYSSSATVIGYLIRMEPFTSLHIRLQSGQFDLPGRLFWSLPDAFDSACKESGDFRELIPEFFTLPAFLENQNHFDFGMIKYNEYKVDDVKLPLWAHSAAEFIHINRMALESPLVSSRINQWVDLIFGFKQRGQEAENAFNVYHPFSYPTILDNTKIYNDFKNAINNHALNFGVVPNVLFDSPSPSKPFVANREMQGSFFTPISIQNISEVGCVSFFNSQIVTSSFDGKINFYKRIVKSEVKQRKSFQFNEQYLPCFMTNSANIRILLAHESFVILAPPTSNYFTMFDLSSFEPSKIFNSENHPGTISALACDTDNENKLYVASAASDSSFFVYIFEISNSKLLLRGRMSSMFHSQPIIDVDISYIYDLIATVDSQMLVFTSLLTGKVIISKSLNYVPISVKITELGYVIVVSNSHENNEDITVIDLYDMMCNKIGTKKRLSKCTAHCLFTDENSQEFAIFAFSDLSMAIMNVFDFDTVIQGELPKMATSITADRVNNCAVFSLIDGSVYIYDFN